MKFCSIVLLLSVGLSFGYATTGTRKGSTIIDYLKDGFDAVYKFEKYAVFSFQNIKEHHGHSFNVNLRKSSQDDPKKFVLHLDTIQIQVKHDDSPTDADEEAMHLPIIFDIKDKSNDLVLDDLFAFEADTKESLNWKLDPMVLLLHNRTKHLDSFDSSEHNETTEGDIFGELFGDCKMTYRFLKKKEEHLIGFETSTRRDQCTGKLHTDLLEKFAKFESTDIQGESKLKYVIYFDSTTLQFMRSSIKMKGKLINEQETTFALEKKIYFDGFQAIENVFDESKNTKMYNKLDVEAWEARIIDSLMFVRNPQ